MTIRRTARGKMIDMAKLAAMNEKTRTVGNTSQNARGDILDKKGNVVVTAQSRASQAYSRTVAMRPENTIVRDNQVSPDPITEEDDGGFDDSLNGED